MSSVEPVLLPAIAEPRERASSNARLVWGGVALGCLAILGIAMRLHPDARGIGTHEQLGLAPCGLVLTTGLPCPTCGMTTSFTLMMHGRPWAAFVAQPLGAILCVATNVLLIYGVYVAVTGRIRRIDWEKLGPVRLALGGGLLLALSWGFKIAHGLIMGTLPAH